jgi:hypothetical protein
MPASAIPFPATTFRDCLVLVACFLPLGCSSSSTPPTATQPVASNAPDSSTPDETATASPAETSADDPTASATHDDDSSAAATTPSEAAANDPSPTDPTAVASARPSTDQPAPAGTTPPAESSDASAGGYHEPAALDVYPTADFTVTADEFQTEYQSDDEAWKRKYEGKVVEVRGKLRSYNSYGGNMIASGMTVMLQPEKADSWLFSLLQDRPWLEHPPGSIVVIRGKIGKGIGLLGDGYIVSSETSTPIKEFSPQELHEQFTADSAALEDAIKRKYVSIKGTVTGRQATDEGEILSLGADGRDLVDLHLEGYAAKELAHWQIGNEVVALAEFDAYAGGERPAFKKALPVSPLTDYPPLPPLETRQIDGGEVTVRPFPAELLGRWQRENQRALLMAFSRQPPGTLLEVRGEVQSVEKAESSFGDDVTVRFKDSYGGLTSFEVEQAEAEKLGIAPGVVLTARGAQMGDEDGMTFLLPVVEVE